MATTSDANGAARGAPADMAEAGVRTASRRDAARFLFRHRATLLGVSVLVVASVTALVYALPQTYAAEAKVLVEYGKNPTMRSDPLRIPQDQSAVVVSEIEIITSRAVAEAVVDRLGLVHRPVPDTIGRRLKEGAADWLDRAGLVVRLDPRERHIRSIQRTLKVKQAPLSSVVDIAFFADSPAYAAEIAGAVTEAYIERHRQIFTDNTAAFFEQRVAESAADLAERRGALTRETAKARIDELQLQVRALEASYLFYQDKLDRARADMAADPSLVNVRIVDLPVVPARPVYPRLLRIAAGVLGGVVLALALALIAEYFDHRVHTPDDLRARVDAPVLGSVRRARAGTLRKLATGLV